VHDLAFADVECHAPFLSPCCHFVQALLQQVSVCLRADNLAQLGIVSKLTLRKVHVGKSHVWQLPNNHDFAKKE
jgi:hypothetical protein